MSAPSLSPAFRHPSRLVPGSRLLKQKPVPAALNALRAAFWGVGVLLAIGLATKFLLTLSLTWI